MYTVQKREAILDADKLPPWRLLEFKSSGKKYSFPFRLCLRPVRTFSESLVRTEFSYVAENLLLRGGYSKSHFQADQTTLQNVSEMGKLETSAPMTLEYPAYEVFPLRFTRNRALLRAPAVMRFKEPILQSAIRQNLSLQPNLEKFCKQLSLPVASVDLEVLGEKALPEGHVDILLKQRTPIGLATKIPIEVKTKEAKEKDFEQVRGYMHELRGECPAAVLVAASFSKRVLFIGKESGIHLVRYTLNVDLDKSPTFDEICQGLVLEPISN